MAYVLLLGRWYQLLYTLAKLSLQCMQVAVNSAKTVSPIRIVQSRQASLDLMLCTPKPYSTTAIMGHV